MDYIRCSHLVKPDEITEIEPMNSGGQEYLVRVIFKSDDRQWGEWMTAKSSELVRHLWGN